MKKIMFSDRYGLTEAVLKGLKTQTRRIVKIPSTFKGIEVFGFRKMTNCMGEWYTELYDEDERTIDGSSLKHQYQIGEVVAIAQSYHNAFGNVETGSKYYHLLKEPIVNGHKGNYNKMFVKADAMPHQIKITDIRLERIWDISDEDCLKEGIMTGDFINTWDKYYYNIIGDCIMHKTFKTPKEAFASLIDKVSGKGTWESNPYVFVYDFELIK